VTLRVVIGGWYGAANLGDELLLRVIADWVHEAGGTPIAISNAPEHTRATHGIQSVAHDDLAALVEALGNADLFTFGGGGLLHDYFGLDRASLSRFPAHNATQFASTCSLPTSSACRHWRSRRASVP
jgi:polysaccharide pyruvyl transferase WcaK-like protein